MLSHPGNFPVFKKTMDSSVQVSLVRGANPRKPRIAKWHSIMTLIKGSINACFLMIQLNVLDWHVVVKYLHIFSDSTDVSRK